MEAFSKLVLPFVLVMEAFSKLVFRGIGRGYLASFSISDVNVQSLVISHLLVLFFLLISNLLLLTLPFKKKKKKVILYY